VNAGGEPSNASLAASALQGDQAAFSALMRRHKGWLYRFVRRYVADPDDAYDVLQESFVAAFSALPRFDSKRSFETWLRRIALNKCRDRARRNLVRRTALDLFGYGTAAAGEDVVHPPDSSAADTALARLDAAIARLPRPLKEPLILTALEGLSQREAGEILGINAKAVETRVYRAKKRLQAELDPADLDDLAGR
jgi:RNA polymerase sigma factor (sigma-70 family)